MNPLSAAIARANSGDSPSLIASTTGAWAAEAPGVVCSARTASMLGLEMPLQKTNSKSLPVSLRSGIRGQVRARIGNWALADQCEH